MFVIVVVVFDDVDVVILVVICGDSLSISGTLCRYSGTDELVYVTKIIALSSTCCKKAGTFSFAPPPPLDF